MKDLQSTGTNHITLRDHQFDGPILKKRKPKRKLGVLSEIDMPAKGSHPVREHHHRDESKILPHLRYNIALDENDYTCSSVFQNLCVTIRQKH